MEITLVLILILLRQKGGKTAIRIVSHYCSVVNNTYVYCRKEILLWKKRSTVRVSLSKIISDWELLPSPCWRLLNSYLCAGIISLNPYITPKRKDCPHFAGSIEVRWLLQGHTVRDQPGLFAPKSLKICHRAVQRGRKVISGCYFLYCHAHPHLIYYHPIPANDYKTKNRSMKAGWFHPEAVSELREEMICMSGRETWNLLIFVFCIIASQ